MKDKTEDSTTLPEDLCSRPSEQVFGHHEDTFFASDEKSGEEVNEDDRKGSRLDDDDSKVITGWYTGPPYRHRDRQECDEYFLRGKNLLKCYAYLRDGQRLGNRHRRTLALSLYAGKHNCVTQNKANSGYTKRAKEEFDALLSILRQQNGSYMKQYLLSSLVLVQDPGLPECLVSRIKLLENTLTLLHEENTWAQDVPTLVNLCAGDLDYSSVQLYEERPLGEVLVGVVHSLLHRFTQDQLDTSLITQYKTVHNLACEPVFGLLGHSPRNGHLDPSIIFNNSAKVQREYLDERSKRLFLTSLNASLEFSNMTTFSDLLLDRVARCVRDCSAPPHFLRRLVKQVQAAGCRPGPLGCVALLRLMRRCQEQLVEVEHVLGLLHLLLGLLLLNNNDRPLTAALEVGRLLHVLREKCPFILQAVVGTATDTLRLVAAGHTDRSRLCNAWFLVSLVRVVLRAAWSLQRQAEVDQDTGDLITQATTTPTRGQVAAILFGINLKQEDFRASWNFLAFEVSQLLFPGTTTNHLEREYGAVEVVLEVASRLEPNVCLRRHDHHHPGHDHPRPKRSHDDAFSEYDHVDPDNPTDNINTKKCRVEHLLSGSSL